jgi:CxxC motif-containing protein (DUF1111 family)
MRRPDLRLALAIVLAAASTVTILVGQTRTTPGDPLPNLTPREFEEFRIGLEDFLEVETAEDGLGPAFNATSCGACHNVPAVGGISPVVEVRAGRRAADGSYQPLDSTGDSLVHLFSIPTHGCQPQIPLDANVIARRAPIPLFGAGLVEAIDDDTLLTLAEIQARRRDGISGRAAVITDRATGDRRVGRFGWKAQHATLLAFSADAYRNEMGITNDLFPLESAYGIDAVRMRSCDIHPEPEDLPDPRTRRRGIDNFTSFMRFLAPPSRGDQDTTTAAGEEVFNAIDCASCHVPVLMTGANSIPSLHRRPVPLYSDLLLHDAGTGDGIAQEAAMAEEIRTPALWGLRFRRPLLHDGSAATIEEAIRRHRGEADGIRSNYDRLSDAQRTALHRFLLSL